MPCFHCVANIDCACDWLVFTYSNSDTISLSINQIATDFGKLPCCCSNGGNGVDNMVLTERKRFCDGDFMRIMRFWRNACNDSFSVVLLILSFHFMRSCLESSAEKLESVRMHCNDPEICYRFFLSTDHYLAPQFLYANPCACEFFPLETWEEHTRNTLIWKSQFAFG